MAQDYVDRPRELITVEHFMNLSMEINYHLSAKRPNLQALLALVLGPVRFEDQESLVVALKVLRLGYGASRRKIGPLAVLHPLRTAALLSRCMKDPSILDLLGALLHDKGEDLQHHMVPEANRDQFHSFFGQLQDRIGREQQWYLGERIDLLTKKDEDDYHSYLLRLLDHAPGMPDLLHVKLADRLDNTLDHHIHRPGVIRYNFYRNVFDLLFVPAYKGVRIRQYHFLPGPEEGALLLMQLFKNAVFLSLIRQEKRDRIDDTARRMFDAIAIASIREAQWVALELFADYDGDQLQELRELVLETMHYCYGGGVAAIREPRSKLQLDGLFLENYAIQDTANRKGNMVELFKDRDSLTAITVTFIATFAAFLNDPEFTIEGIDRNGIYPILEENSHRRPVSADASQAGADDVDDEWDEVGAV